MKNTLIVHGTNANHTSNWFPWLEKELANHDYKVLVPDLPHSEPAHYNIPEYKKLIESTWEIDSNSVLIGHSGGAVVLLSILENLPKNVVVKKVIFVSGYTDDQGWPALKDYFSQPHDWKKIRGHVKEFVLFHSDNDSYMSREHGMVSSRRLRAKLRIFPGCGHFNLETDKKFKQFPELLEEILHD